MVDVAVVDYGMGNLRSVEQALRKVAPAAEIVVSDAAGVISSAKRVVFPGQGAMPDCMRELDARGLRDAVLEAARHKPFLGICIGLQMLFESSDEGDVRGLAVFAGRVRRFPREAMHDQKGMRLKVPHMGWNRVQQRNAHPLWSGIEDGTRFYFVHSYYAEVEDQRIESGVSDYGLPFTCAVARDNIFAVQFHPEKSHTAGLRMLLNFVDWNP